MAASPNPRQRWRPAPFAMHAPDRRRALLEHALALCCILVFAAAFLPRPAGHDALLRVPVAYHRLQLKERAPAQISLDLPAGAYTIDPQSLGYFAKPGEFVYTAAVARGLIYGRSGRAALILEIAAPEDSRAFLDYHLDIIRAGVLEQNRQANLLAQARSAAVEAPGRLDREVAKAYQALGPAALLATDEQAAALVRQVECTPRAAAAALARYAPRQAALKQRYYACQRARLDVVGQQAALQLALARLPEPPGTGLLSLGDAAQATTSLKNDLEKAERTWRQRLFTVLGELAGRPGETHTPGAGAALAPLDLAPAGAKPAARREAGSPVELANLAQAMRTIREEVLRSEEQELRLSLDKLAEVRSAALSGRPPGWTELPRMRFTPRELAQPSLAALPGYSALLGLDGVPAPTLALLRQLARRFEDRAPAEGDTTPPLAQQGYPFELPYGLLAIDLVHRHNESGQLAEAPGAPGDGQAELAAGLASMLDEPDSYGLAALDLAYLRCLQWYAAQPVDE